MRGTFSGAILPFFCSLVGEDEGVFGGGEGFMKVSGGCVWREIRFIKVHCCDVFEWRGFCPFFGVYCLVQF